MIEFVATVVYAIPAMDELRRRFPGYVHEAYEGITFTPIKACEKVGHETRKVEFMLISMGRDALTKTVLAEIKKQGLRPALPEELLAFDANFKDEMLRSPIAALGAVTEVDGKSQAAFLWCHQYHLGRCLNLDSVKQAWDDSFRFLAVRK